MNSSSSRKQTAGKRPPFVFDLREKIKVAAIPVAIVGFLIVVLICGGIRRQRHALTHTLSVWRENYHLDDRQMEVIRRMEMEFHGNGSPFSGLRGYTAEEIHQHHLSLSRVMNPEDGPRFLNAMEKKQERH